MSDTALTPYERYGFAFDIDQWYEQCKEFTFRTTLLPITPTEARVLCNEYETITQAGGPTITVDEQQVLSDLKQRIQNTLESEFYDEEEGEPAAFVRLSGRSPKDSVASSSTMSDNLTRNVYQLTYSYKSRSTPPSEMEIRNDELIAYYTAQVESMKFSCAEDVLDIHCSSLRVYEDLQRMLEHKLDDWSLFMAFREFMPKVDIALEFRGFVYNAELTALSQYFDELYFQKLHTYKGVYLEAIRRLFATVKEKLPWDTCIMDFVIYEPEEYEDLTADDLVVQVIEFNPFNRFTSPSLFSWEQRDVLEGKAPFEFRLRNEL